MPKLRYGTNLSFKAIIDVLERSYGLPPGSILGDSRTKHPSNIRALAMHICRHTGRMSFPSIGKAFKRHHATAIHNCRLVDKWLAEDKKFVVVYNRLVRQIIKLSKI